MTTGEFLIVNGVTAYYEEHGDGGPLDPDPRRALLQRSMGAPRSRARRQLPGDHTGQSRARPFDQSDRPTPVVFRDPVHLDAQLGEFAEEIKALHPGGAEQWRRLVRQTAPMWLDYEGLGADDVQAIQTPVLVVAGDRDELIPLELAVSLYRALPHAELAVSPWLSHDGPTPERAAVLASLIRDFARRHT